MALKQEMRLPVVVNPEITVLPKDWRKRVFGAFDFIVTDMARAPAEMKAEAIALLTERSFEQEGWRNAD